MPTPAAFDAHAFAATLALIGVVIIVSALLSGLIERSGVPQVALFLVLGALLGPFGLGVVDFTLQSPALPVIAIVGLVLVLFTDAVTLDPKEVRSHAGLALLALGPGTVLTAVLTALAAWWLLDLPAAGAVILGAALASTDPVLLRGLLRNPDLPRAARDVLGLESGMNDAVLLPIILVGMAVLGRDIPAEPGEWVGLGLDLFVLGPGAGMVVGLAGIATLELVRPRIGVRRDYESLYALGIAFAAYAAAEAVGGSGLLAAFAAGLTIASFDVELCDCFLDYGQATAEMFLLFAFVALGGALIWRGLAVLDGATLAFVAAALLIRPAVLLVCLARTRMDRTSRYLVVWFGPRGLSSLLLILLPVFAAVPGSERLFDVTALVVLVSIVLHGGSLMLVGRRLRPQAPGAARAVAATAPPAGSEPGVRVRPGVRDPERISFDELRALEAAGELVVLIDSRSERAYRQAETRARGAVRLAPDGADKRAAELGLLRDAWLVAYCA